MGPPPPKRRKLNQIINVNNNNNNNNDNKDDINIEYCSNHLSLDKNLDIEESKEFENENKLKNNSRKPIAPLTLDDLTCIVCMDLPKNNIYQCRSGHVLCQECHKRYVI